MFIDYEVIATNQNGEKACVQYNMTEQEAIAYCDSKSWKIADYKLSIIKKYIGE